MVPCLLKAINETREHGGINGLTPSEMFLQRLITSTIRTTTSSKVKPMSVIKNLNLSV